VNSIRPLATITFLAVAGVYLYFKINETEPQLPMDVAEWTLPAQVEIHEQSVTTHPAAPPAYGSLAPTDPAQGTSNSAPTATLPAAESRIPVATQMGPTTTVLPDLPPLPEIPAATTALSTPPGTPEVNREVPSGTSSSHDHGLSTTQPPSATRPPTSSPQASSPTQSSLFGATRLAVQGALDRGELSQALLLLSDWYGDPSLAARETQEVDSLLGQLAGSVIYSTEHRLEPPYLVQAGEKLEDIAKKYSVPWQLLAKINGIDRPDQLQPGQKLKVIRGPFSALIDLGDRQLTVMLARRYAGKFAIDIDPQVTVEEGHWQVDQKLVTPGNLGMAVSAPGEQGSSTGLGGSGAMEEESLILTNTASEQSQIAVLRGPAVASPVVVTEPKNRVIRLKSADVRDVFDILSVGSKVIIRR
jgi:LysM repeat protein